MSENKLTTRRQPESAEERENQGKKKREKRDLCHSWQELIKWAPLSPIKEELEEVKVVQVAGGRRRKSHWRG